MRWNIHGATGILTLRCHQASNPFDHIWTHPHIRTTKIATAYPYHQASIKINEPHLQI